jgi:hypothetical protein
MSNHVFSFLELSMVKTRITNCRFKRFTNNLLAYRKIQEKAERFLVGFFRKKLKKLKCKALSILEHDNKPIELWSNKVIQQRQIMYTIILSKKG